MSARLFLVTDVHGSEVCRRKSTGANGDVDRSSRARIMKVTHPVG